MSSQQSYHDQKRAVRPSPMNGCTTKAIWILIFFVLTGPLSCAQTFSEFFRQKKTQKKYHAEQIVALKELAKQVKKGVQIVGKGVTTISHIRNGNFNLHRDFFSSLNHVNPNISAMARVADITAFIYLITRDLKNVNTFCKTNGNFTPEEVRYVAQVYINMMYLCDASLTELLIIFHTSQWQMTDDEALERIDKIHKETKEKQAFVQTFKNDTIALAHQREKEKREKELLKRLHGI